MKKLLTAGITCGLTSIGFAQSSLTINGAMDLAFRHVQNGAGTLNTVSENGISTSKIAIRGEEDLGGGMKSAFWLESQIDPDVGTAGGSNGTTTAFWNRRSTVALMGSFGEVRLGRDYVPTFFPIADFDPANTNGIGNALNLINQDSALGSGAVTNTRANNAVSYFLPGNLGGWMGQVMAAPGEGLTGQRYLGGRVGYASGPFKMQAAFSRTGTATADEFKQTNAAVSYDFGVAKLNGIVNENKYGAKRAMIYQIGAVVPAFGNGEIHAAYEYRNASGAGTDANDAKQWVVGYWYFISKRTTLYGNIGQLSNSGKAAFTQAGGAAVGSLTGFSNKGIEFGIRTFF